MQFAIVAALPVVIISMLAWQFLIPQMRRTINLQQRSLAVAIAGQISMHLMGGQRNLTALADYLSAGGITLSPAASTALMDALCSDGALFETIFTIRDGETTIHSVGLAKSRRYKREDLLGLDISGRRFLDVAWRAKKPVWSETFLSTVSGRLAVALTVPMQGGVIVGELALDQLSATIRHLPVEAGLFTLVLDG